MRLGLDLALSRPGGVPFYADATVALDFANSRYRNGLGAPVYADPSSVSGFSFSRTGVEYEATSSGLLVPSASGVPGITDLGLGVWQAETELLRSNTDLTNAVWSKGTASVAMSAAGPDGVVGSAAAITFPGASSFSQTTTTAAGANPYTVVVYARADSATTVASVIFSNGVRDIGSTNWNLTTAWQRFTLSVTGTGTDTGNVGWRIDSGGAKNVYLWLPGLRPASLAGPAIANSSAVASATRGAASASVTFNTAGAGTFYVEGNSANSGTQALAAIQKSDGSEAISIYTNGTTPTAQADAGGVTVAALTGSAVSAGQTIKAAFAYSANDFAASFNGGAVQTDVSGALPNLASSALQIGGFRSGFLANADGMIRRIIWYPTRLSNAQLQAMTS